MQKTLPVWVLLVLFACSTAADAQGKKKKDNYEAMDYGPFLCATIIVPAKETSDNTKDSVNRGIAVPFDVPGLGKAAVLFDTELLRYSAVWTGGFITFDGVIFNGKHGVNPGLAGKVLFHTKSGPGWAKNGDLKDPREKNKDPRDAVAKTAFGPLPRDWGRYKGLYRHEVGIVIEYTAGASKVLDMPRFEIQDSQPFFCRTLFVDAGDGRPQQLVVADFDPANIKNAGPKDVLAAKGDKEMWIGFHGGPDGTALSVHEGRILLNIPAALKQPALIKICQWAGNADDTAKARYAFAKIGPPANLTAMTRGGKAQFTETVTTQIQLGTNTGPYAVDSITVPFTNPYKSWMRIGGVDFFSDGRAAVSTWSGDVWVVSGLGHGLGGDGDGQKVVWKRFATGLFQPLGLKIVNDIVHVTCRDGIIKLHDLNGDGEADFYECFNNDFITTPAFHEFLFDLNTDRAGNFYFIKAGPVKSGGRDWETITPSSGSLFKLSKDGKKLEVIARGFRAPNGMSIGPNDEITTGDNEGTWTPTSPINWIKPGGFYGVPEFSRLSPPPTVRENPLCWLPHQDPQIDNSSGCQVWITGNKFGPLSGQLLHTSYGTCKLFNVLKEQVGGQMQGGAVEVLKFDCGVMRGRFVEKDNVLYLAGLRGWQTTATKDAGFYRIRYMEKPAYLPVGMHVEPGTVKITFSDPLSQEAAQKVGNYNVQSWYYKWTSKYGSPHFKPSDDKQGHEPMTVTKATLSPDGKTVTLHIANLKPVMQMSIQYNLKTADDKSPVRNTIYNTINVLGDERLEVIVGGQRIVKNQPPQSK